MLMIYFVVFAAVLLPVYLFCIAPGKNNDKMRLFENRYIAHRGFFDNKNGVPENSLSAFALAAENGYGIEFDIQRTSDGKLVVFHDDSTGRICGEDLLVTKTCSEKLRSLKLLGTDEKIPFFDEVLKTVGGRVPLLIEIKPAHDNAAAAETVMKELENYEGLYCVQSFNPFVLRYLKAHYPSVAVGQLSTDLFDDNKKQPLIYKLTLGSLLVNFVSRPDFMSFNVKYTKKLSYNIYRIFFKTKNAVWTVSSKADEKEAKKYGNIIIFEKFDKS